MASYIDPQKKLKGITACSQDLFKKICLDAPSTYTTGNGTYSVVLIITSGYRTPEQNAKYRGAQKSQHLVRLAVDVAISLNGTVINYPGSYGNYSRTPSPVLLGNDPIDAYDLYHSILAPSIARYGCVWGGNFDKFDPIHMAFKPCTAGKKGKVDDTSDSITYLTVAPSNDEAYVETAGTETIQDTEESPTGTSPINSSETQLYIGYGLVFSSIQNNKNGLAYVNSLLSNAGVEDETKNKLEKLTGLSGEIAYTKYLTDPNITISEEQAESIFIQQLDILTKELTSKGFKFSQYPKQISTAIVSYFFGKNTGSVEASNDITTLLTLLSKSAYDDIASFFEKEALILSDEIKQKRLLESSLVRSYKAADDAPAEFLLTSTVNPTEYESNLPQLRNQLNVQLTQLNNIFSTSKTSPASDEYDEMFNDISASTITAVAAMMQSQQVNYDTYLGTLDDDYTRRLKIKNLYTILSRYLNYNISSIDNLLQSNPMLENKSDYTLREMYDIIPFSQNLGYIVKNNAVRRCELRIRILEKKIKDKESDLYSTGLPDLSSWSSVLLFLSTLWLRMSAVAISNLTSLIESLFSELAVLKEQHRLEKNNLKNLVKDRNRYRHG
jgi:hypothetical protein